MNYVPNPAGMAALQSALDAAETDWAGRIADRAREIAPVRTGTYRDAIRVDRDGNDVVVVADAPYSIFVELGTSDTPAFAPLTRASDESAIDLPGILAAHGIDARFGR